MRMIRDNKSIGHAVYPWVGHAHSHRGCIRRVIVSQSGLGDT
jgi:hypothetical protein